MSYPQFGYTYSTAPQLLVTSQGSVSSCDANRSMVTDPLTGQTVCSCQYDSRPLGFTRINSSNLQGTMYTSPYTEQTYPSISLDPAAIYPSLGAPYGLKEGSSDVAAWQSLAQPPGYYPYDPAIAAYTGYSTYDFNGARRKNATRETTATLKAWLHEHKKNPYPTKGEKIMLAIITKMTLTQVSTWFANARRRLKKENKMTWEPKNKTADDDEDEDLSDADDDDDAKKKSESSAISGSGEKRDNDDFPLAKSLESKPAEREEEEDEYEEDLDDDDDEHRLLRPGSRSPCRPPLTSFPPSEASSQAKPKIWSLADTATCKTPPPPSTAPLSYPSGQAWVPSLGAFQVPSVAMSRPSSHPTTNNGALVSSAMQMVPSCRQPTSGTTYSEFHTDTPPQTPPNLKMAGSCHDGQMPLPASFHSPRTLKTSLPPRLQAISTEEQRHLVLGGPPADPQRGNSGTLFTASDLSNTAFKPIFKRESPWT